MSIARFNAACAASLVGDMEGAKAHVEAYLELEPGSAGRVLHDADLAALRGSAGFGEWLERRVRRHEGVLRSLVFERRETGGDLFTIDEDCLHERPLATDPDVREYRAEVSGDGRYVVYLATPFSASAPRQWGEGHAQRDWSDVAQHGRLYDHRWDQELRVVPFEGGAGRVVGTRVHSYRLIENGTKALFLEGSGDEFRVMQVVLAEGAAELVATIEAASTWCYALRRDGSLIVAEGLQHRWASALTVRLAEYRGGVRNVLMESADLRVGSPRVPDFQICDLSSDEQSLHLGLLWLDLSGSPTLRFLDGLELGNGAYSFRRVGSRGSAHGDSLFLTVIGVSQGDEEEYTGTPFPRWQTSPLSWENNNGMSAPWWYESRIVRVDRPGEEKHFLSPATGSYEYGPALSEDGELVALTRVRPRVTPWILITDRDGNARRRLTPGQYAMWRPMPR